MCEITVRALEPRAVAERAIDAVSLVGIREGVHVDFHGTEKLFRWLGDLAVDSLAPNNHEFVEAHRVGCSPNDVVELIAAHLPDFREDLASLRLRQGAGERRRLAEVTHHGSVSA